MKKERWQLALSKFRDHFGYSASTPEKIDDMNKDWSDFMEKSVADDFDYTIERYGTIPPRNFGLPNIIID